MAGARKRKRSSHKSNRPGSAFPAAPPGRELVRPAGLRPEPQPRDIRGSETAAAKTDAGDGLTAPGVFASTALTTPVRIGRVSQSVQTSVSPDGLESDGVFASGAAVSVDGRHADQSPVFLDDAPLLNCADSRRAALSVLAQINTPEVGRSSRWTIPR